MPTLYGATGTSSAGVEAVLEEAGVDFQRVMLDLENGEQRSVAYVAVNPRGQVPSLVLDDGSVLTESAAIMLHIADTHPQANLLPAVGSAKRGIVYRWMFFLATNIYEGVCRAEDSERYTTDGHVDGLITAARRDIDRAWGILNSALGDGPYLLGEQFCVADIYLALLATWHSERALMFAQYPNVARNVEAVLQRPKISNVFADNDLI